MMDMPSRMRPATLVSPMALLICSLKLGSPSASPMLSTALINPLTIARM